VSARGRWVWMGLLWVALSSSLSSLGCASHPLLLHAPVAAPASHQTWLHASDGTRLFAKLHPTSSMKGWVWLLEGTGGATRDDDDDLIVALLTAGFGVAQFHPRGSGFSEGPRGDVDDFQKIHDDFDLFAHFLDDAAAGAPVFLLGQSAGGALALDVMRRAPAPFAGVVLLNPAYKYTDTMGPSFVDVVTFGFNAVFRSSALTVDMMAGADRLDGEDRAEVMARQADPTVVRYFSLRYLQGLGASLERAPDNAAAATLPLLLVYGERDVIIDHSGSRELFALWAHADKQLVALPEAGHGASANRAAQPAISAFLRRHAAP